MRKFIFMGNLALSKMARLNQGKPKVHTLQFDDLETFEHTKCKPLSVTLAVEEKTRRILDFEVSQMPAKGHLSKIALKKYGFRKDERALGRKRLFKSIKPLIDEKATIKSDENPHYYKDVKKFFPKAHYIQYKGKRGRSPDKENLKK